MKQDLKSMTLAEIKAAFQEEGLPAFRSLQVYRWGSRNTVPSRSSSGLRAVRRRLTR